MKSNYRLILVLILVFSWAVVTQAADDDDAIFGDDAIFSDESMTEEVTDAASSNETKALEEKLHIGGNFSFALTPAWTYGNDGQLLRETMGTTLNGRLYFDARPDEDSRFFGKIGVAYPFVTTDNSSFNEIVKIQELFSDFNYQDKLFFRAGKHTIKWGVGYFFSPSDVLNLAPIDPDDPEAEREGPVSLKAHYPFGVNNLYGYLIANDVKKPGDLAIAVKTEYLAGNLEFGIGGFYQPELAPRAVLMVTLPTSSVDFFGEAVLSYGSDKIFLEETDDLNYPLGIKTVQKEDGLFPGLTVGFNLMTSDVSVICQYLYNGEGYIDPSLLQDNQPAIGVLLADGELGLNDLKQPGRHYGAASINFLKLFKSNFGSALFWIGNLSDGSGLIKPALSWKIIERATLSLSLAHLYGETGTEFAPFGSTKTVSVSINFGSGSF